MAIHKKSTKLRFGIMCDSCHFPQWQADAIKKLLSHKNIQCHLLIINQNHSILHKITKIRPNNFFWFIYSLYLTLVSKANRPVNLTSLLANLPQLPVQIIKKGQHSEYFHSSDIRKIKSHQLDFILRSARSAGTPFKHQAKLYRPSMDCSEKYGSHVTINQIQTLTKTSYQEMKYKTIPQAHTISQANHFTLVDSHQQVFIFKNPHLIIFNLRKTLNKLLNPLSFSQ